MLCLSPASELPSHGDGGGYVRVCLIGDAHTGVALRGHTAVVEVARFKGHLSSRHALARDEALTVVLRR